MGVNERFVQAALDSEFADVEDAIQYLAALSVPNLAAIVTGDPKGFKVGELLVISPSEAQQLLAV